MLRKLCYSVKKVQQKPRFRSSLQATKKMHLVLHILTTFIFLTYHLFFRQLVYLKYHLCCSARHLFLLTWAHDYTVNSLIQCKSPWEAYTRKFTTVFPFYLNHPSVHEWMKAQDVQAHSFHIKVFCWNCSTCSQPSKKKKSWGLHFVEELYKSLKDDFKY